MCEKSAVVGVVSLAVLATFIGFAGSDGTEAANATLAESEGAVQASSHVQATPSVLAVTAMMATAIGLAAALRHQASSGQGHRNRIRPQKVNHGAGGAKPKDIPPIQPARPLNTDEEDDEGVGREIRREDVLKKWQQIDENIREELENGRDIDWERMMSPEFGPNGKRPYGKPYGKPDDKLYVYGKPYGKPYGSPYGKPYGRPYGSPYGSQPKFRIKFCTTM